MAAWQVWLWGLAAVQAMMVLVWVGSLVQHDASLVDRFWAWPSWCWAGPTCSSEMGPRREGCWSPCWSRSGGCGLPATSPGGTGATARTALPGHAGPQPGHVRRESLVRVFLLQGLLAWLISLPLLAVATRGGDLNLLDALAVVVWAVGLFFEAVGDWQLSRFLADPANRGKVMNRGLWRYTRHPNYFGDTTVWVAYALFALATGWGGWYGVIGTVLMAMFIVRVSGVALTEKRMASGSSGSTREGYDEYVARTNAFFPGPPKKGPVAT